MELELKLQLKRLGADDFKSESEQLLRQVEPQLATLDSPNKEEKKRITDLTKDRSALQERLARTNTLFAPIGGILNDEEAKTLILKKLHAVASSELDRYFNAAKRHLIQVVENLWEKYALSNRALETERTETLTALDGFLTGFMATENLLRLPSGLQFQHPTHLFQREHVLFRRLRCQCLQSGKPQILEARAEIVREVIRNFHGEGHWEIR